MRVLPIELQRLVYEYDSTYHEHFTKEVLPEIQECFWKKLFYRLTRGIMDFTGEEWEAVSDFSDEEDEDDEILFENMFYHEQ
jgi:hypothetical protein